MLMGDANDAIEGRIEVARETEKRPEREEFS